MDETFYMWIDDGDLIQALHFFSANNAHNKYLDIALLWHNCQSFNQLLDANDATSIATEDDGYPYFCWISTNQALRRLQFLNPMSKNDKRVTTHFLEQHVP